MKVALLLMYGETLTHMVMRICDDDKEADICRVSSHRRRGKHAARQPVRNTNAMVPDFESVNSTDSYDLPE